MFEQYLSIKADYTDTLLFYRMGDFYELFFEDAEIAARELQIALTSRNPQSPNPVPMCGVPHHSAETYISQLLDKGHAVAICDQISDPKASKGLVERAVTLVRTPGTAVEDATLHAKENNYLGALYWDENASSGGFAWLEYSTGAWTGLASKRKNELWQWVQKMNPKELLVPDLPADNFAIPRSINLENIGLVRLPVRSFFDISAATTRLQTAQGIQELGAIGLEDKPELTRACGAILGYLLQTQKQELKHLAPFQPLNLGKYLILDEITEKNLELFRRFDGKKGQGTLWHVLDATLTPMGGRLLEERIRYPWRQLPTIEKSASAVSYFFEDDGKRTALRRALDNVYDLERLSTRIFLGRSSPRDFIALRQSLLALQSVHAALTMSSNPSGHEATSPVHTQETGNTGKGDGAEDRATTRFHDLSGDIAKPETTSGTHLPQEAGLPQDTGLLQNTDLPRPISAESAKTPEALAYLLTHWDSLEDIAHLLERALVDSPPPQITDGGLFKQGYHAELDTFIDLAEHGQDRLNQLLATEQKNYDLPKLKLGNNRVFGYYFELSRAAGTYVPEHFERRQTLANAERYVTPALKELEQKIFEAADSRNQLEYRLFNELRCLVSDARPRVLFMASLLAQLDFWQSLAEVARKNHWTRPCLDENTTTTIRDGRHPVVESLSPTGGFVPNNIHLDEERRLLLITGPNMAGKSTILRQIAIITILAQMGSFVPASAAHLGLVDRIFSRVGASDNLAQGQSTFMVEMMETARILRQATRRSLVILDEIGRGTSTYDGLALAWAVVEDLLKRGDATIRTLFATHYHELTNLEGRLSGLHNMNIAVTEQGGEIIFMHRLVPGPSDRSYGIEVAKLAGVPLPVVNRAKSILRALEETKKSTGSDEAKDVIEQMLPGFTPTQTAPPAPLMPEIIEEVPHPMVTALSDVDTDSLTPLMALNLINEWKQLWGEKKNDRE